MGEFHGAVSSLLDAFARGIGMIKAQRKRRKAGHVSIDQSSKAAETQLSKSLKKSRTEVQNAYGKDLNRLGSGFAEGDGKQSNRHSKRSHARSKSAPELCISSTPLGPAITEGWVRPKAGRKLSTDSRSSGSSTPKRSSPKPLALPAPPSKPPTVLKAAPLPAQRLQTRVSRADKRKSFMSFASDSTKLGEIPEHKWGRNAIPEGGQFPITPYYPVQLYQEPEKPRSRFMRLFRR
ncbi:hypothetical protein BKA64DRAFT_564935 [Cadophora sp. MPI-SDFR-AT-0126]|nr:hypothetical protein BKA64DRAFT_564935 [Leotiomycetes sp. MPI-SDFR-AT-0126]